MSSPAVTSTTTSAIIRYKRIIGGRVCTGIRLHHKKISIQTIPSKLFHLLGFFKRRFFSKIVAPHAFSSSSFSSPSRVSTSSIERRGGASKNMRRVRMKGSVVQPSECRLKSLRRTNSFYAEAIADCLEFINRSSTPLDARTDHHQSTSPRPPLAVIN